MHADANTTCQAVRHSFIALQCNIECLIDQAKNCCNIILVERSNISSFRSLHQPIQRTLPYSNMGNAADDDLQPHVASLAPSGNVETIIDAALAVLTTPDPWQKAALTDEFVEQYAKGRLRLPTANDAAPRPPPDMPARSSNLTVLHAKHIKNRGKCGSAASRIAVLHSLCHIESWAVDLAWDVIARFGAHPDYQPLPPAFFDDFVHVAADECRHMRLLANRLVELGSHYGALSVHDGLWESAARTAHSLPARLAVEHCVHEARGLDVLPQTIHRLRSNGDAVSAALLEDVIYPEEVTHCAAGVRWLRFLHTQAQEGDELPGCAWAVGAAAHADVTTWFHELVGLHFFGSLKPPFNEPARAAAGFTPAWYCIPDDGANKEGGGMVDPD